MNKNLIENIREVSGKINDYIKSDAITELDIVENKLAKIAEVDFVKLYKINTNNELADLVEEKKKENILIFGGLLSEAIKSKKVIFENHITSSKHYMATIDNPLGIKVKSLLILPILGKGKVIGIVFFYRKVGNRKVFNIKLEKEIVQLTDVLYYLFIKKTIEKSFYLENYESKTTVSSKRTEITKKIKVSNASISKYTDKSENLEKEYAVYKSDTEKIIFKIQKSNEILEKKIQSFEDKITHYNDEVFELTAKVKKLEEENTALESVVKLLEEENTAHLENIEKLTKTIKIQAQDQSMIEKNIFMQNAQIEKLEKKNTTLLRSQKTIERKELDTTQNHSGKIIELGREYFGNSEYTRIIFELIAYTLYSEQGLTYLEEEIISSGIVKKILNKYSFRKTIIVNIDKSKISNIVSNIKSFENLIFNKRINLNMVLGNDVPSSVYIDAKKLENIILHLLIDLFEFIDEHELEDVSILGHSMGGKVAMRFALENAQYISKLIVVDISMRAYEARPHHKNILKAMQQVDFSIIKSRKEVEEVLAKYISEPKIRLFVMKNLHRISGNEFEWRLYLEGILDNLDEMFDGIEPDEAFDKPSLFIRGGASDYVRDSDIPDINKAFPNHTLHTIPNATHWVHAEAPELFYQYVSEFLQ